MCRALAGGVSAVVAARALAENAAVIEAGGYPSERSVTVLAQVVRADMSRRFAGCLHAVVTTGATAGQRGVIHEGDRGPVRRNVAIRTLAGGDDVVDRLERRAHDSALCVTTRAGLRRRAECRADVATIAIYTLVRPIELEARAEVVERLPGERRLQRDAATNDRQENNEASGLA